MAEKEQKSNKKGWFLIALGVMLIVFAIIWALNRIDYTTKIDDMISKEYTFESYQYQRWGKRTAYYVIYVSEEPLPVVITDVSFKEVNIDIIESLTNGNNISCRVIETTQDGFAYEITEMSHNGKYALTLDGYIKTHNDNQVSGCYFFSGAGVFITAVGVIVLFNLDKRVKFLRKLFKPIKRR